MSIIVFYAGENETVEFMVFECIVFGQLQEQQYKELILKKYNYLFNEVFVDFYNKFQNDETEMDPKDVSERVSLLNELLGNILDGKSKYSNKLLMSNNDHPSFVMIAISIAKSRVNKSVQFETKEALYIYNKETDKYQEEII